MSFSWANARTMPAIFIFGDSLADVGNNNYVNTSIDMKADFLFNGIDSPLKTPSGRFSNGYNTFDWLAKFLGHRQSPPAYLSITNVTQMSNGVNFASGGSGILDTTGTSLTFTDQIKYFSNVRSDLIKLKGEESANLLLSNSLFLISSASNDMFEYYLGVGPQNNTEYVHFVATLVNKFSEHLKTLYDYGARKFGIVGISHIGCIPVMRNAHPTGDCFEDLNVMARMFNKAAKAKLHHLKYYVLHDIAYSYGNIYPLMTLALSHPEIFGYKETSTACCGSGKFNGAALCDLNAKICSNRDQYMFWDRYHPTEIASKYSALALYAGSRKYATPINVWLLAELGNYNTRTI